MGPKARKLWLAANLLLGLLPGFLFFAWIERNCALPGWWTWAYLPADSTLGLAVFDIALILGFGIIHSGAAQTGFQGALARVFPVQAVRTVYLIITGATAMTVMGFWQNTGHVLWALPTSPALNSALSLVLFWGLLGLCGKVAQQFDARSFFGWKQLSSSGLEQPAGNERLQTTGFYGWVRHPIYTLSFAAFLITPFMSLDRMLVIAGLAIYLAFGIPLEERKLILLFGDSYREYRRRVPAIIPRLKAW